MNDIIPPSAALLAKYNAPVPRYTSYPPANHFSDAVTGKTYDTWLKMLDFAVPISLYIHLPFCKELCYYCGCHMRVTSSDARQIKYMDAVILEIGNTLKKLPFKPKISDLHFGGGTPTFMPIAQLERLFKMLNEAFDFTPNAHKAIEIDPRTLTSDMAQFLGAQGINRASLGVQDTDPTVQEAIHRIQPLEQVAQCVDMLRKNGITALNFDLIYGLPHQTEKTILQTVEDVSALEPSRIALFGYAHVPWMKKHQKILEKGGALPTEKERVILQNTARSALMDKGYIAVGLDHFARPEDDLVHAQAQQKLRRNFQGYTTDSAPVMLGFGASAISQTPFGMVQNTPSLMAYEQLVADGALPIHKGYALTKTDKFYADIIEELMCNFSADIGNIAQAHEREMEDVMRIESALKSFEEDGLLTLRNHCIDLSSVGKSFVRSICAAFDPYFTVQENRHAQAV